VSELIDNRAHRISVLKEIIQHLHAGTDPALVKERLRKIVGETDATEIMAMEQQLMAEGMPVEEVRSMCDLHSQVTRDVLVQVAPPASIQAGHPVDTFRRENSALKQVIATMRGISAESPTSTGMPTQRKLFFASASRRTISWTSTNTTNGKSMHCFRVLSGTGSPGLPK